MNVPLVIEAYPVAEARSEKVPSVPSVILQPAKVATPLLVATGFEVHASVPVPVATASVIELELPLATLPPASSSVTRGWTAKTTPPVDAPGVRVNASCVAGPATTLNAAEVAATREPSVAVSR